MALLQKQHLTQTQPYYKVGTATRKLVVGLGNVGKEYEGTRHNIGFVGVDSFAQEHEFDPWINKKNFDCLFTKKILGDSDVILIKPTTYMNASGRAVQAVCRFYQIDPSSMVVVHDDLDIAFGQIRMRLDGADAGNKGIRSIKEHVGSEFGRVRIGIGNNEKTPATEYVLQKFSPEEQSRLSELSREVATIITEFVYGGSLPNETRSFLI